MNKIDLSKQPNKDPLVLWKTLANVIRTYDDVDSCEFFIDGKKKGFKVRFKNRTKVYDYIEKPAIINLLKGADKDYWRNLPF